MPYLQVELDALNAAPSVARACGLTEEAVIAGLLRLWSWGFREKQGFTSTVHLRGFFGCDVVAPLVAFGFVQATDDADRWRIRGSGRWLAAQEARAKGGRAAVGNLKKGTEKHAQSISAQPGASRELAGRPAGEQPGRVPGWAPGSSPALYPITNHQDPKTRSRGEGGDEITGARAFFDRAQAERVASGLKKEPPPSPEKMAEWWRQVKANGVKPDDLFEALISYARDPYWQKKKPRSPFIGFMTQWEDHL